MSSKNITIKLEVTNEHAETFKMEETIQLFPDLGCDLVQAFGEMANLFLRQIGYATFNKDCILMESVTEDEAEMLYDYLQDIRNNQ